MYVTDYNNNRLEKFDSNGVFMTSWGSYDRVFGQIASPYAVAVDAMGRVYRADYSNYRVQVFIPVN